MAKTIKELTKEYATKNPIYSYDADTGEVEALTEEVEAIYEDGANAVLEKVLTYMESKPAHKGERFYNGLKDYIEQLKG